MGKKHLFVVSHNTTDLNISKYKNAVHVNLGKYNQPNCLKPYLGGVIAFDPKATKYFLLGNSKYVINSKLFC